MGTVLDIGQMGTVLDIGQMGTVLDIGQIGTVLAMCQIGTQLTNIGKKKKKTIGTQMIFYVKLLTYFI